MSKMGYGQRGDKAQQRREREVIKLIAEENARGYGRDSWIATTLNARGYKSPGGAAWSAMAIRRVIETPRWSKIMEAAIEAKKPKPEPNYSGSCGPDVISPGESVGRGVASEAPHQADVRPHEPAVSGARGTRHQDENFVAKAQAMHGEFIASGQQVLRNVGVPEGNFEAFERWARTSDPESVSDAVRDLVTNRSVSKLANLGRSYMEARESSLERKLSSMNIETKRIEGMLYISREAVGLPNTPPRGDFKGSRFISVRDAERLGKLTINE